jgi:predicted nucleotidyltransferase
MVYLLDDAPKLFQIFHFSKKCFTLQKLNKVMNIVEQNMSQVSKLLEQHNVDNIYLFGSVLTENFSPTSDIDFLVNFGQVKLENYFDNYIGLKNSLEIFFNRSVDLVEEKTVKNPVLRRSIDRNKKLIYGRARREMVV